MRGAPSQRRGEVRPGRVARGFVGRLAMAAVIVLCAGAGDGAAGRRAAAARRSSTAHGSMGARTCQECGTKRLVR